MSLLAEQLEAALVPAMKMPPEFVALFDWIESNDLYVDNSGGRIGFLFPEAELRDGWTDTERPGGTQIVFGAAGNAGVHHWFGHANPDVINRICVFAQTGNEGSQAAFWIDDNGNQRIVHMGSGSGSVLCCVLADSAIDFLRLLAIGYDEICWNVEFQNSPNDPALNRDLYIHPNLSYQSWVAETFGVSIPSRAIEIVQHPAEIGDTDTKDEFCRWVNRHTESFA